MAQHKTMTNHKISTLTSASTPLAGTEMLAIVQSGTTVQVAISNLTAGRNIAMSSAVVGLGGALNTSTSVVLNGTSNPANGSYIQGQRGGSNAWIIGDYQSAFGSGSGYVTFTYGAVPTVFYNTSVGEQLRLDGTDVKATLGNFVQGTAAKGINFTANTPAAGMTSQLLNWYEEGTWTPNQGAGLTVVGAFSSSGTYTRIGKKVFVTGTLAGATSIVATGGAVMTAISLYNTSVVGTGTAANGNANSGAILVTGLGNGNIYAISTIASSPNISFSATFLV